LDGSVSLRNMNPFPNKQSERSTPYGSRPSNKWPSQQSERNTSYGTRPPHKSSSRTPSYYPPHPPPKRSDNNDPYGSRPSNNFSSYKPEYQHNAFMRSMPPPPPKSRSFEKSSAKFSSSMSSQSRTLSASNLSFSSSSQNETDSLPLYGTRPGIRDAQSQPTNLSNRPVGITKVKDDAMLGAETASSSSRLSAMPPPPVRCLQKNNTARESSIITSKQSLLINNVRSPKQNSSISKNSSITVSKRRPLVKSMRSPRENISTSENSRKYDARNMSDTLTSNGLLTSTKNTGRSNNIPRYGNEVSAQVREDKHVIIDSIHESFPGGRTKRQLNNKEKSSLARSNKKVKLEQSKLLSSSKLDIDIKCSSSTLNQTRTHVIFCIDYSGSMRKNDVNKKRKTCITRWQAVFDCANDFVDDQLSQYSNNSPTSCVSSDKENIVGTTQSNLSEVVFSLIIFNTEAKVIFECIPLGDGTEVRRQLNIVCEKYTPQLGTMFSPALKQVRKIASKSSGPIMVFFLSDGRPADLSKLNKPIPEYYTVKKKRKRSAGMWLNALRKDHGERLSLQFVCIYNQGKEWMEKLSLEYNGTFHMSRLDLDIDIKIIPKKKNGYDDEANDNNEMEVIGIKSANTRTRERYALAVESGNVVNVPSSMRNTFRTISSTLTSMRTSIAGISATQTERRVIMESASGFQSKKKLYKATWMVMHTTEPKFIIPPKEKVDSRIVHLSMHPFAQGGLRNVYHMTESPNADLLADDICTSVGITSFKKNLVAKESRYEVPYKDRLRFHQETSRCQERSVELAKEFNAKAEYQNTVEIPTITFLQSDVYRLRDTDAPGGFRYLAVEERLHGRYEKFNSNNGYILKVESGAPMEEVKSIEVAQAYSHFTFEESGKCEIVVDIQGSKYCYTDPQLHSNDVLYGRADRGKRGVADFFTTHKCNDYCNALGLMNREPICV